MLVKDLIEILQNLPQDAEIVICNNDSQHDIQTEIDGFEPVDVGTRRQLEEKEGYIFDEGYDLVDDDAFVFIIQGS